MSVWQFFIIVMEQREYVLDLNHNNFILVLSYSCVSYCTVGVKGNLFEDVIFLSSLKAKPPCAPGTYATRLRSFLLCDFLVYVILRTILLVPEIPFAT
jgi:hypothetical protein